MRALPWALLLAFCAACATTSPPRPRIIEVETTRFDGVHYPTPRPLPVAPQPPPAPVEDPQVATLQAATPLALAAPTPDLHNAALRDRETDRLLRTYLGLVDQLYHVGRQMGPGGVWPDALAVRKWHADAATEMAGMMEQAAALEGAFVDLAQACGVDLAGPPQDGGRAGRVRALFHVTACIRRDLAERARDGLDYLDARRRGVEDAELRAVQAASPEASAEHMIRQTSATLTCAQLAGQALAPAR